MVFCLLVGIGTSLVPYESSISGLCVASLCFINGKIISLDCVISRNSFALWIALYDFRWRMCFYFQFTCFSLMLPFFVSSMPASCHKGGIYIFPASLTSPIWCYLLYPRYSLYAWLPYGGFFNCLLKISLRSYSFLIGFRCIVGFQKITGVSNGSFEAIGK